MNKNSYRILSLVLIIVCSLSLAAAGRLSPFSPQSSLVTIPPGSPIEIALATCNGFPTYQDHLDAVQMAFANVGPIKGFSLQRNDFLTLCDQTSGANAANTIVANLQNVGVVGPLYSSSTFGAAPVFETASLVMISYANSHPDLPAEGPNIFNRVVLIDPGSDEWAVKINALPEAVDWRSDFESDFGRTPDSLAVFAYDSTKILLEKIQEVSIVDGSGNLVIDRAALATAVRTTVNYPGKTGPVTFEYNGNRVDPLTLTVNDDPFDDSILAPNWSWIAENPANWSLAARPGYLRIITEQSLENILVQEAPLGNFEFRTRLQFQPSQNYQVAGLTVYTDDANYLRFGRAFCNSTPPACVNDGIYFDNIDQGVWVAPNHATTLQMTGEIYLRLVRNGDTYTGFASPNGTNWTEIGSHTVSFKPLKIGLVASNQGQPAANINADFDNFLAQSATPQYIYLPMVRR